MSGTVTCQSCGKPVPSDSQFCAGCGTEVAHTPVTGEHGRDAGTQSTQCVKCGGPMSSDDQFCPKCGAARPEAATVVSHVSLRNTQALQLIDATKGDFEIIRELGVGAMGAVYLAKDIALGRRVAIKIIAPSLLSDDTMISRFRLEAQTVASLRHPNIVAVHAVRQSEDLHFFVMEFIDGPSLSEIVKTHAPLDIDVVQGLLFQVGSALSYAHRTSGGVIHRDIKPANIMVERGGDAFVTDFGISKIAESKTGLTQTGATIGTPEYMSPEQCRGEPLTGASDQYALGVVAYQMLCGHTPFSGTHYYIMVAHTSEPPKPIRELRPDCPDQMVEAVERMLAKTPEERWPDLDSAVAAMGGAPLGHHDPTRTKIIALTGTTLGGVPAVDRNAPTVEGARAPVTKDTATSVSVTGLPSLIEAGDSFQLAADVRGSGDISLGGQGVQWASTDPEIAKVEDGVVQALRAGSVSITAAFGNVANSVLLTVTEPTAANVLVTPSSVQIQKGGRIGLSAQVEDRRGRELDRAIRWLTSDAAVATVTQEGEVVATGGGSVTVTAESNGVTGTAEIVVEVPAAEKAPPQKKASQRPLAAGAAARNGEAAQPWYRHRGAMAATLAVVLGVSGLGLQAVLGGGATTPTNTPSDTASSQLAGGEFDSQSVVEANLTEDDVSNLDERELELPEPVADGGGEDGFGTETQTTSSDDAAEADPPPADPVPMVPSFLKIDELATTTMDVGGTQFASAQIFDRESFRMAADLYVLSWQSTDTTVISVSPTGSVRANGPGTALLVAVAGNAGDSVEVTVAWAIAGVRINDNTDFSIEIGESRLLSASVVSREQQAIDRPIVITWSSSDIAVATVGTGTGQVTSVAEGEAQIIALVEGFSDTVTVTVEAPAPTLPTVEQLLPGIELYVSLLGQGDRDAVTSYWGADDGPGLDELLDRMGKTDFTATLLGPVHQPVVLEEPDVAAVSFDVEAVTPRRFGGDEKARLNFRAKFKWVDSRWQLDSCVMVVQ